jgi:hypothetical protein
LAISGVDAVYVVNTLLNLSSPTSFRDTLRIVMSLTVQKMGQIVADCQYKDWTIDVGSYGPSVYWIEVNFWRPDSVTGEMGPSQNMRRWPIESWRDSDYVINTIYKAIATAEEHEMRENFKYKGKPRFDPHIHTED